MSKTPIFDAIMDKIMAAGNDGFTAITEAKRIMREFKASGKASQRFGIMGAHGKCVEVIELRRKA